MKIDIIPLPIFNDNYIWAIDKAQGATFAVVDPGDSDAVLNYAKEKQKSLSHILITHHHHDHIGGVASLKNHFPDVLIIAPHETRIPDATWRVVEGDELKIGELSLEVIETPGHTLSHICYVEREQGLLFCGDTLFSGGCGRLFEGDAPMMHHSLAKLARLPASTHIFCAHEYTLSNLLFAKTIEPNNKALLKRIHELAPGKLSLPSSIGMEKAINPFLRVHLDALKVAVGKEKTDDIQLFKHIRDLKDRF